MYNQTTNYVAQPQSAYTSINRPVYQMQQFAQPYMGIKGRPVASIDEARASIIDFDGSVFYFPDLANKRIYTKQINLDGTASLFVYELKELPVESELSPNLYVTREEFEAFINSMRAPAQEPPVAAETPKAKPQLNF